MNPQDLCNHTKIRLIAAALGHQQCTAADGTEVLIPGTNKRILIGDDAYLARVALPSALACRAPALADERDTPSMPKPILSTTKGTPAYSVGQMLDYARTYAAHQAAPAQPTEGWLIEWDDTHGHRKIVRGHDCSGDYSAIDGVTVTELVRRAAPAQPPICSPNCFWKDCPPCVEAGVAPAQPTTATALMMQAQPTIGQVLDAKDRMIQQLEKVIRAAQFEKATAAPTSDQQAGAVALEAAARIAESFGPNRPIATSRPSGIVLGRWEGEQAASRNIAAAIRALKAAAPAAIEQAGAPCKHEFTYFGDQSARRCWRCDKVEGTVEQAGAQPVAQADYVLMPKRLTAENGAKGALSGEFKESVRVTCHECEGSGDDENGDECPECKGDGTVDQAVTVGWDTIKDIYKAAVALLAAPTPATDQDALDAKRWRAFINSARIRPLGSAGLNKPEANNYAHMGLEIWTRYGRDYSAELLDEMDRSNAKGREWLIKYADVAIEAQAATPVTDQPKQGDAK